jgi:hypothetical protein
VRRECPAAEGITLLQYKKMGLDAVRLEEVIEMAKGVALLVGRRCKEVIAGVSIKDSRRGGRPRQLCGFCCLTRVGRMGLVKTSDFAKRLVKRMYSTLIERSLLYEQTALEVTSKWET